jgi:hypothetical protein
MQLLQPIQQFRVEIHNTIGTLEERPGWANGHTRSIIAVITAVDEEVALGVGELALLDVFDPGAIDADRDIVLGFAGDRADMAADALALSDDKPVFHTSLCNGSRSQVTL